MSLHVKKGDTVVVLTGKDSGAKGKVLSVDTAGERVIVEGVNVATKHKKPKNQQDIGGIVKKEAPIHASNVMVICPKCNKPTRTGHTVIEDGDKKIKVRVCKKCGATIKTADDTK